MGSPRQAGEGSSNSHLKLSWLKPLSEAKLCWSSGRDSPGRSHNWNQILRMKCQVAESESPSTHGWDKLELVV